MAENQNDPLGILDSKQPPKGNDPLGILSEKKAQPTPPTTPPTGSGQSISEGGTLELANGVSGQLGYSWNPEAEMKKLEKPTYELEAGALGTKPVVLKPEDKSLTVTTHAGAAQIPVNKSIQAETTVRAGNRQERINSLINDYENFKATNQTTTGDYDAAQFYMDHLKKSNPDQYNYISSKYSDIQNRINEANKSTDQKYKDIELHNANVELQKLQADTYAKALVLKNDILGGKIELLNNNAEKYYGPQIDKLTSVDSNLKDISTQISDLSKTMDGFEKDKDGKFIVNQYNKNQVEEAVGKYNDLVNKYNESKAQRQELLSGPLKGVLDQINDVNQQYKKNYVDAQTYLSRFPEVERLKKAQEAKQLATDIQYESMSPIEKSISSSTNAIGQALTDFIKGASYLPKAGSSAMGAGDKYGWTDRLYDKMGGAITDFNNDVFSLPTNYSAPIYNSDTKKWNTEYLPAKVARGVTDMALMMAGGEGIAQGLSKVGTGSELASNIGTVASGFVMEANNSYQSAIDAGMNEKDAEKYANINGMTVALLELVSPNKKLFESRVFKSGAEDAAKKLASGATLKDVVAAQIKERLGNVGKEVSQEVMQTLQEKIDQYAANELAGANFQVGKNLGGEITETVIVTALTTALTGGVNAGKNTSQLQKDALYMAAKTPDKISSAIDKLAEKDTSIEPDKLKLKVKYAAEALNRMPEDISDEKKAELLPALTEKIALEEAKKKADNSFKAKYDEQLAQYEKVIQEKLNLKPQQNGKEEKGQEGVLTTPETKTETTTEQQQNVAPVSEIKKEEVTMTLPSQIQGGMERSFQFSEGSWKQKVGNELVDVSPKLQDQLEQKFQEEYNQPKTENNAIQKQTTGENGVRNETALGEGVGGQNQPEITTQEGEQKIQPQQQVQEEKVTPVTEANPEKIGMVESGEPKKEHALATRVKESAQSHHKQVYDRLTEEEKKYNPISVEQTVGHVRKVVDKIDKIEGATENLAHAILNGDSPFSPETQHIAAIYTADKLNKMAEEQTNETIKKNLNDLADRVYGKAAVEARNWGQRISLLQAIAKDMPSTTIAMRRRVNSEINALQEKAMTSKQKQDIKNFQEEVNKAVNEELEKIAKETMGEEELKKFKDAMDSLKIDLSNC